MCILPYPKCQTFPMFFYAQAKNMTRMHMFIYLNYAYDTCLYGHHKLIHAHKAMYI